MITMSISQPVGYILLLMSMLVPSVMILSYYRYKQPIMVEPRRVLKEKLPPPKVLFGFSTGHVGTTTVEAVLGGNTTHCPWQERLGSFEYRFPDQNLMINRSQEEQCIWVQESIIPQLKPNVSASWPATYVDMGHFNNLGYVLECLADSPMAAAGELAWVRIRRNRYDVARSFSAQFGSPCHDQQYTKDGMHKRTPATSYCPHSQERHNTPIYLPTPDEVWMGLTPYQKFLWLADEMEYRFFVPLSVPTQSPGIFLVNLSKDWTRS
jgi:hypothetical protein